MNSIEDILRKIEEDRNSKILEKKRKEDEIFEIQKKQKEEHFRRTKIYENSFFQNSNTITSGSGLFYLDIPEDFYIATLSNSSKLLYYTDSFRTIDLYDYLDDVNIRNSNEIVRDGSDFYLCGNFGSSDTYFIKLTNCRLKNGTIFQFDKIEHRIISSYINYVHGMCFYKGYIYLSSRQDSPIPTADVARIKGSNIDEINTLKLSSSYVNKRTSDIIAYKDHVYIMPSLVTTNGVVVKMDLALGTYSALITTGTVSTPSRRVRTAASYLIYNDEIFIPIINNISSGVELIASYSHFGMEVWGLDGIRKRQVYNQTLNTGGATLTPLAHWMGVFNNKLIISNAVMGGGRFHRSLVRMDINTLEIEESIPMDILVTDDNSIFSDGYIYLNGELSSSSSNPKPKIVKIKYDDFTDRVDLISDLSYLTPNGSYGSLNPTSYII